MKTKNNWILFFLIFIPNLVSAQFNSADTNKLSIKDIVKGDLNYFIDDISEVAEMPLHFNNDDWFYLAGIIGAAGITLSLDNSFKNTVEKNHNKIVDQIVKVGDKYGSGQSAFLFPIGFYGLGFIIDDPEIRTTGRILFESLLVSGLITQAIKTIVGRSRPYQNRGTLFLTPFTFNNDYNSFPSGHSVVAFTISAVLSERFDNTYLSVGLYSLAALTAYQRIYSNNHWLSDTAVSAMIAIAVSKAICNISKNREAARNNYGLSIMPTYVNTGYGFSINYSF